MYYSSIDYWYFLQARIPLTELNEYPRICPKTGPMAGFLDISLHLPLGYIPGVQSGVVIP